MRVAMIDNYDSFTYNLVQYLSELGAAVDVVRNDAVSAAALLDGRPAGVVISPGPGDPDSAGISLDTVRACAERGTPLLGVCLGHQSIGQAFGGRIVRARRIMHGKTSVIEHDGKGVFEGINEPFPAGRYHSLVIGADHVAPSSSDRLYRTWPFFGQTAHRSFVESLAIVTVAAPPLKPAVDAVPGMVANVPTRV